jgi:hypothetical protein
VPLQAIHAGQHCLNGHWISLGACEGASSTSSSARWGCSKPRAEIASTNAEPSLDAYNAASRDDAEELYGDYVDALDAARDALTAYRDTFARTLEPDAAEDYERAFNQLARRRFPELGLELD